MELNPSDCHEEYTGLVEPPFPLLTIKTKIKLTARICAFYQILQDQNCAQISS